MSNIAKTFTAIALGAGLTMVAAPAQADTTEAIDLLDDIRIEAPLSMDTYERDSWAPNGWIDADGTGCTTQQDILIRDTDPASQVLDGDCVLIYGTATDPYSGVFVEHDRDAEEFNRTPFDIDHVVSVADAHRSGGEQWDDETRQAFYQDKDNLLAVIASENQAKSDGGLDDYLPPNQALYCDFVGNMVYVKHKYDLAMTQVDHDVAASILADDECQGTIAQPAVAMSGVDQSEVSTDDTDQNTDQNTDDDQPTIPVDQIMQDPLGWATQNPIPAAIGTGLVLLLGLGAKVMGKRKN